MSNEIINSIVGSYDSTPMSIIVGQNSTDDCETYLHCELGGRTKKQVLTEDNQEKRLAGTLVINRETLGGHTFVAVIEGRVKLKHKDLEGPSIRYILHTQGTSELPRSGILDFYPSDNTTDSVLCLSISELIHPTKKVMYNEFQIIKLDAGPGATNLGESQLKASLENITPTIFGEQFAVARKLAPLLGGAGIEMLYSLQALWVPSANGEEAIEVPFPNGGPVNPYARGVATNIAARM